MCPTLRSGCCANGNQPPCRIPGVGALAVVQQAAQVVPGISHTPGVEQPVGGVVLVGDDRRLRDGGGVSLAVAYRVVGVGKAFSSQLYNYCHQWLSGFVLAASHSRIYVNA